MRIKNLSHELRVIHDTNYAEIELSNFSELLIECGAAELTARINEAYAPDLIPSPDRVMRGESYEKEFKRLIVGRIKLAEGQTEIKLKCLTKQGESFIDVKALNLKLLK